MLLHQPTVSDRGEPVELVCDLVSEEVTRQSMATLRDRSLLDLHEELVEDVERDFAAPGKRSSAARARGT